MLLRGEMFEMRDRGGVDRWREMVIAEASIWRACSR